MTEDYGHYIDAPGEICSPSAIPALVNVLNGCSAYYGMIGGDDVRLGKDMGRIQIMIDSLKEYHGKDSDVVST